MTASLTGPTTSIRKLLAQGVTAEQDAALLIASYFPELIKESEERLFSFLNQAVRPFYDQV